MRNGASVGRHEGSISRRRLGVGVVLATVALFACTAPAMSAGGLAKYEIVPGESIGHAALGMTRNTIQNKLGKPVQRSRDTQHHLYSLTYNYPKHDRIGNPGGLLIIVFHGLSPSARAVYMLTVEPSLGTRGAHVGVGDTKAEMRAAYAVTCYHSNPDGSRDPTIDRNQNSECELHSNGGFTYFSFASRDADPDQRIGVIAVATRRVD